MAKQIPMIFNQDMVKAVVVGKKSVTRRPMKPNVEESILKSLELDSFKDSSEMVSFVKSRSPVQVGDMIWVRETFRLFNNSDECGCSESPCACPISGTPLYRATQDDGESKWKPSIHMPKSASRLTLVVTDVYAEKIQNITEEQAEKEGMPTMDEVVKMAVDNGFDWYQKPSVWFKNIWNKIYGNWSENPYVWVIEFEVVHKNILKI